MPFKLTCPCGKRFLIPDEDAAKRFACPLCKTVVPGPRYGSEPATISREKGVDSPFLSLEEDLEEVVPEEVVPEEDKPDRKKKKQAKVKKQGLAMVSRGLAINYASTFVVFVAVWLGIVAAVLTLAAQISESEKVASAMTFFYSASSFALFLAGVLEMATLVLCMAVPDGSARRFLFLSLVAWPLVFGFAVLALWAEEFRYLMLATAFLALFGAWTLWMFFLRRTAVYIKQPEIAEEARRTFWKGLWTMVLLAVLLMVLILYGSLLIYVKLQFLRYFLIFLGVTVFLGMIRIAAVTSYFESVVHFLLFPTGMLYILTYLNLIGSVRMVIWRRT
jgi:hypothetical protein